MKWFLALIVALNLLVGAYVAMRHRQPIDIHAQEVNPSQLKTLPDNWQPAEMAASAAQASAPQAKVAASAAAASSPLSVKPAATPAKIKPAAVAPAKKASAKPAPVIAEGETAQCMQWAGLNDRQLVRVQGGLAPLRLASSQMSSSKEATTMASGGTAVRYWVYYPDHANGAVASALSDELKGKGFDNYIVQNEGEFLGTLSLGLFGKQEAAHALVERLKAAGYDKAKINVRGSMVQTTTLRFKSLSSKQSLQLTSLQRRLTPDTHLQPSSCGI
jgi:hypothetical protein